MTDIEDAECVPSRPCNSCDLCAAELPYGAQLLDELHAALTKYVILPSKEAADAVALWIAATHGQDAWEHAPRCAVVSPEKRCGKSRLMDIAEATCHQSLVTVNISPAALVRTVTHEDPPTLFIDEADTIFGPKAADNNEDLRGIVNSGHQRGRPYIRYDMMSRRNETLATFCMAMLAGIGELPDTIMDRSVVVRMRRRASGESVAPYRTRRDQPALHRLRDRLHAWMSSNVDDLTKAEPKMPLEDRAADTWEPLFAVADLAGGHWPKKAETAALAMVDAESKVDIEASIGGRLLADIKDVFTNMTVSFLASQQLVNLLRKVDDSPWNELDLTTRRLAARLRPYGVGPGFNSAKTERGYQVEFFSDAFARYLPSESVRASDGDGSDGSTDDPSVRDDSNRPTVSAGQHGSTDARTVLDGQVPMAESCGVCGWPVDSAGHEQNCAAKGVATADH